MHNHGIVSDGKKPPRHMPTVMFNLEGLRLDEKTLVTFKSEKAKNNRKKELKKKNANN